MVARSPVPAALEVPIEVVAVVLVTIRRPSMRCSSARVTAAAERRSLRVCILGAGAIAEAGHLPGYLAAGAELAAVADLDGDRVRDLAERFPIGSVYADWREMLAVERPDVVSVCLPNRLHEEATVAALEC